MIILDPNTGELLADCQRADLRRAQLRAGLPRCAPQSRDRRRLRARLHLQVDHGRLGAGERPGQAADARFPSRDVLTVGDRTIHNAEDGFMAGTQLHRVTGRHHRLLAQRRRGRGRDVDRCADASIATIRAFGFGDETNAGMPGENPGIVPPPADWSASTLPTVSFGHGIATTPIAMARAYAAIANGGLLLRPRILSEIVDADGRPIYQYGPEVERRVISADDRRHAAPAICARSSCGVPATRRPKSSGYTTAGKTGTAQVAQRRRLRLGGVHRVVYRLHPRRAAALLNPREDRTPTRRVLRKPRSSARVRNAWPAPRCFMPDRCPPSKSAWSSGAQPRSSPYDRTRAAGRGAVRRCWQPSAIHPSTVLATAT